MRSLLISLSLLISISSFSQVDSRIEKIVNLTSKSISEHSSEKLEPYLAKDFEIAGQSGDLAKMILSQLISQLNDRVVSYKFLRTESDASNQKYIYEFEYESLGTNEVIFVINQDKELISLELFEMEYKTIQE